MDYTSIFADTLLGRWFDTHKKIIKCAKCKQKLRIPINKGSLRVTCPKCKCTFDYSPHILLKKCFAFPLLLIGSAPCAILVAYLNHFYDITGFSLFFVIPAGSIVLGLGANIGFVASLAFLRTRGINYHVFVLILISGSLALCTFWLSQYIYYSTETATVQYYSREPPPELEWGKKEIKQLEARIDNLQSSIENSSRRLRKIESRIVQVKKDADLGYVIDQEDYQRLISQYNDLVSGHNTNVKKAQKLHSYYQAKLTELNALIDRFNRGEIGEEVTLIKKERVSKTYSTFIEYIKKATKAEVSVYLDLLVASHLLLHRLT